MVPGRRVYVHAETEWADESGEEGTWEVWEVDGEDDTLYCQNLSLFGKLWLDNKSIFFDVGNFKYYLLVFHGPSQDEHIGGNYIDGERQVVGFFSKEKMSWDHNNLACIVVFPPWQHKSLGNLLIGVSYEISKREKVLGGPEKPISESGKRSYMKYWGSVIANFVINDLPSEDITISLDDLAQATWISKEDCLEALKIMGISEGNGKKRGDAWVLHKCIIREWLQETKTSLVPIVNPDGFHDGLFVREASTDEEDENEEDFLTASMLVTRGGSAQTDGGFHDYSHSNRGGLLGV